MYRSISKYISILLPLFAITSAASADDWPCWRGPTRNDIVDESSLFDQGVWPPKSPAWAISIGEGATSPIIVAGRVYVMGYADGLDTLYCLDAAKGSILWKTADRAPRFGRHAMGDQALYSCITSTPEFDRQTGYIYTLGVDGDLRCRDTNRAGHLVWAANLYDRYGMDVREKTGRGSQRDYGYTSSPLVHGETLVVEVGSPEGTVMGFDKRTGRQLWTSQAKEKAGHTGGPVPIVVQGVPCIAVLTLHNLLVVRLDRGHEGETVASYPWATDYANNVVTPAVYKNFVLITAGYNHNSMCKLAITLAGARKVWEVKKFSKVCTPVIYKGAIYWVGPRAYCLDFETGDVRWQGSVNFRDAGSCIITNDDRWIIWGGRGDLVLAETAVRSPSEYRELAKLSNLDDNDVWPHVALSNGRIFCKGRHGKMTCFDLGFRSAGPAVAVNPTPTNPLEPQPAPVPIVKQPVDIPVKLDSWPGATPGLVLAWQRGLGTGRMFGVDARPTADYKFEARGSATSSSNGTLLLKGGAMLIHGADDALLAACRKSSEWSLEVVLAAGYKDQSGPARIISFSADPYNRNFTLGQEGDALILRLRTPRTGDNGTSPETKLCTIDAATPYHLIVTYRDGRLDSYLNGRRAVSTTTVRGDLSNWVPMHLLIGDEWKDNRQWKGAIERFAILSRFMTEAEAKRRYELVSQDVKFGQNN